MPAVPARTLCAALLCHHGSDSPPATGTGDASARKPASGNLALANGRDEDADLVAEVARLVLEEHGINAGLFLTLSLPPEQMADVIQLRDDLSQFGGEVEPQLVIAKNPVRRPGIGLALSQVKRVDSTRRYTREHIICKQ